MVETGGPGPSPCLLWDKPRGRRWRGAPVADLRQAAGSELRPRPPWPTAGPWACDIHAEGRGTHPGAKKNGRLRGPTTPSQDFCGFSIEDCDLRQHVKNLACLTRETVHGEREISDHAESSA